MRTIRPALVVALLTGTAGLAHALEGPPEAPPFGMVGLARTQVALLSAVLTHQPDEAHLSCLLTLSFVDARGQVFKDRAGAEVKKAIVLRGNAANGLALRASDILADDEIRKPIRPVVVEATDAGLCSDCRNLALTLELVGSNGITTTLASSLMPPRDPPPPDPHCLAPVP
jgi:hypothetical protein